MTKSLSTEMQIIYDSFKKIEVALFEGRFTAEDLNVIKRSLEVLLSATNKTIKKSTD